MKDNPQVPAGSFKITKTLWVIQIPSISHWKKNMPVVSATIKVKISNTMSESMSRKVPGAKKETRLGVGIQKVREKDPR